MSLVCRDANGEGGPVSRTRRTGQVDLRSYPLASGFCGVSAGTRLPSAGFRGAFRSRGRNLPLEPEATPAKAASAGSRPALCGPVFLT